MKYWLINYLSPFYLMLRIGFLMGAFFAYFAVLNGLAWGEFAAGAVALLFVYNALRPWKVGGNFKDIQNKVDDLSNRYK